MDPAAREAQRIANREKNERRRQHKSRTMYAETGRELRQKMGGAFGKEDPVLFNKCAEGTTAIRRAETELKEEDE